MKKLIEIILGMICVITVCFQQPYISQETNFPLIDFNNGFFYLAIDFTDLEPRSSFNTVANNPETKELLRGLFLSNIHQLLTEANLKTFVRVISILQQTLDLFSVQLFREIKFFTGQIFSIILLSTKRIINPLAIIIFATVEIFSFLIFSYLFFSPKAKVAPLVLRC